jgi:hypothetical protein
LVNSGIVFKPTSGSRGPIILKGEDGMNTSKAEASYRSFGPVQIGIILLTAATAFIHFYLNVLMGKLDLLFTLNGLGYLGLLAALFMPVPTFVRYRSIIRTGLILFTLLTIVLWIFLGSRDMLAYIDKAIEIGLVMLLWLDRGRR